jgi:hypothetical protein
MSWRSESFFAGAAEDLAIDGAALENFLTALLDSAVSAHPPFDACEQDFLRHLPGKLAGHGEQDVLGALRQLRGDDLWLAFACLQRCPCALSLLDDKLREVLPPVVAQFKTSVPLDEVIAHLRVQLIVGSDATPPVLGLYGGREPLGQWLQQHALESALELHDEQGEVGLCLDEITEVGAIPRPRD